MTPQMPTSVGARLKIHLEHSPALELGHSPALELGCKKTPRMQFGVGARTQEDTAARETLQTRGVA